MTLWRISDHLTLDGNGGLQASGRWHTRGTRIVYCAPNPATALLEILVNLEIDLEDVPASLKFLKIESPEEMSAGTLNVSTLGPRWKTDLDVTRRAGDEWLRTLQSALLLVPCVIVPETTNILINPRHPDSTRLRLASIHHQGLDPRLYRG